MALKMNVILLSGGSGTRLWPLSNEVRSKQFLKILKDDNNEPESMVQRVYRMIKEVSPNAKIIVATSGNQIISIRRQLGEKVDISLEPCRRDTFPAIALSVAYLHDVVGIPADETVVVCPVDPLVDIGYFETIKKMNDIAGESNLTLMGIKPTYPSEKYGYIIPKQGSVEFKEKPDAQKAEEYIRQGALWNGGVFAFKVSYILNKAKELCGFNKYQELFDNYSSLNKISFDYAVAEKEPSIKVVEYCGEWKDLGTWNTFTEAMHDEIGGNAVLGENCKNVHVINELSIPVVGLGLEDVVIAASPDGVLVSNKIASAQLKKYVPKARPMYEQRAWGEYKVLNYQSFENNNSLTKELVVLPGNSVSYQKHQFKTIIWTVISGSGYFLFNGEIKVVKAGDSVTIKENQLYSVKAIDELHIIEVQVGKELTEEDIERVEFDWNSVII